MTVFRFPWAVDAIAVELSRHNFADKAVPDKGGPLTQGDAIGLSAIAVEKTQVDAGRVFRKKSKIGAVFIDGGA